MYIQGGPEEIQAPAHLNLIGCSITTILSIALSPTSHRPVSHNNIGLLFKNVTISMHFFRF
jgi:hypothetical protein